MVDLLPSVRTRGVSLIVIAVLYFFLSDESSLSVYTSSLPPSFFEHTENITHHRSSTFQFHFLHLPLLSTISDNSLDDTAEPVERPLTIVVQLSGELGNQLSKIAAGLCLQFKVETDLGIPTEIKLRAQEHSKSIHAAQWTKTAFPNATQYVDFREANTPFFDEAKAKQQSWMESLISEGKLNITDSTHPNELHGGTQWADESSMNNILRLINQTWILSKQSQMGLNESSAYSIPHVYSTGFLNDYCLDNIYYDLRAFFKLDESTNCKIIPYPDETVLHRRNFIAEMPKRGVALGFEELDEFRTIELFAEHKPGDKVAIISRMDNGIDKHIKALEMRNLTVRYIKGQSGNEDFCFLMKAQKEIIGHKRSTYMYWAGILGEAKRVRLHSVDTPRTRASNKAHYSYNFSKSELKERFIYENYKG